MAFNMLAGIIKTGGILAGDVFQIAFQQLSLLINDILKAPVGVIKLVGGSLKALLDSIAAGVRSVVEQIVKQITDNMENIGDGTGAVAETAIENIQKLIVQLQSLVTNLIEPLLEMVGTLTGSGQELFEAF